MRHVLVTTTPGLLLRVFTASLLINSLVVCSVLLNATTRPTVALIPDAWHSPIHYLELTHRISQGGHSVVTQRLPSCDSNIPKSQSITTDAAFIRSNVLLPQIDNGEEMVLIMHSYGGCPGSMAADGLSVSERRKIGKPGGIIGMIMICGFVIRAGQTLRTMLPGDKFQPWVIQYVSLYLSLGHMCALSPEHWLR